MPIPQPFSVLFTGYAPVHFACFRPLYERLRALPGVQVTLSGGLRSKTETGWAYDAPAMYRPFGLPASEITPVEAVHGREFEVEFSGNTKSVVPTAAKIRVQIFHGVSYRNKAVRPEILEWDYFFIVGPYMRRRFAEAGLLPAGDPRALDIGFPKTDRLLDGSLDRAALLDEYGLSGDRPILVYAPTGAKKNSLEVMGEAAIEALKGTGRYDILVKPHDHPKNASIDWFARLARFEDGNCRVVRELDVIKLLFIADLLISDASSVVNEYALLDRPIVFLDTPELIDKARDAENSMLDLDTWGRRSGVVVRSPAELAASVDESLAHAGELSEVRCAVAADLFYNPGTAVDAAMAWIERNLMNHPVRTAA
jgi:CDP-glycerol glycerophosphotransferase (TagB/SpsB family)